MNVITCENLSKTYKDESQKALDSVSFSVPNSGIFGLIGRNGAGKTTLIRILATELLPSTGSAFINGLNVVTEAEEIRKHIAIVPQEARPIPWMTPRQTVLSYLLWRGFGYREAETRADEYLVTLGLVGKAHVLNRMLSGGMKRKLMVATVLASGAKIIFLDEPTTGLDPLSRRELWKLLKEICKDHFIFLTTHYLEEAEELASTIGILDHGQMKGVDSLDGLRTILKYPYSIRVEYSTEAERILQGCASGEIMGIGSQLRLLTTEAEAFAIAQVFLNRQQKVWMEPVSLEDIFMHFVNNGNGIS
ncbi:MAG: ABC transporter ATP-binding protein [Euryarchaeota archaeon]|jgi:ABC-2 type transport system ATP-binding protein|nr:ABC transporter ATP-binding protein [Euryarchaeota archaeon]